MELLQSNNTKFVVPMFQRNYSWDTKTVGELWNDLRENYEIVRDNPEKREEGQYLLGSIVLVRGESPTEVLVVDGQQRLATLTILFCAARDIMLEDASINGSTLPGTDKIDSMIQNTDLGEFKDWKLVLNDTDRSLFEAIQRYESLEVGRSDDRNTKTQLDRLKNKEIKIKSQTNIKKCYEYFHKEITTALETNFGKNYSERDAIDKSDQEQLRLLRIKNVGSLQRFIIFLTEYNFIVKIMVSDDSTAFQVFETLNYRGLELAKSNLIKNHLLSKVGKDDASFLSNRWNTIFDTVIGQGQKDDEFMLDSLRSRPDTVPKDLDLKISTRNLYKIVKGMIKDEGDSSQCKEFINNLAEDAEFLRTLNEPASYKDIVTRNDIDSIKMLDAKAVRAPILAAHRKWMIGYENLKLAEYRKLVRTLVKFFFKFRTVRRKHPGEMESIMADVVTKLNKGESFESILAMLKSKDDHENFINEFKTEFAKNPKKSIAKYVLQQITMHYGNRYDDVKPIDDLTLEHVLPRKNEDWDRNEFFKDGPTDQRDISVFVSRLGNLTLLKDVVNSIVKTSSFYEKKHAKDENGNQVGYNASKLSINVETVCKYEKWTARVVEEREEKFAKVANIIWSLDS